MRITNRMLVQNVLRNINNNLARMQRFQHQQSSGKVVSRPSDDPIRVTQALYMRSALSEQQQHIKNMKDARNWLDATDTALANASEIIHRAKDLAIRGANGALPQEARDALADEIDELIDHLVQVANTSHTGRYIFAGTKTTQPPFEYVTGFKLDADGEPILEDGNPVKVDRVAYTGNQSLLEWEVSPGVTLEINKPGDNVFGGAMPKLGFADEDGNIEDEAIATVALFNTLFELSENLRGSDTDGINKRMTELDIELDNNLSHRATAGAKYRRMEMAIGRAEEAEINTTELLSNLEDIDIAEVNMLLSMQSYVYQASLMTGAKVLQPSLIDFIK